MARNGKNAKGFSLIELVIVVSVLSILAAIVAPQVNKLVMKSKISRIEAELKTFKTALSSMYSDLGVYPREVGNNTDPKFMTRTGIPAAYSTKWDGPYIERWPTTHPWGGTYDYQYGNFGAFNLDGTAGNEVYMIARNSFTRAILERIDRELDDGNRNAGMLRHNNASILYYYCGEGARW